LTLDISKVNEQRERAITFANVREQCEGICVADPKCKAFKFDYRYCDFYDKSA